MSHKRKVVLRVVIGLLGLCAISLLVTYVVLRPARAIGPGQQHNTEPEPENDVSLRAGEADSAGERTVRMGEQSCASDRASQWA